MLLTYTNRSTTVYIYSCMLIRVEEEHNSSPAFSCVLEIYLSFTQDVLFTCMTRLEIKRGCTELDTNWPLVLNICAVHEYTAIKKGQ